MGKCCIVAGCSNIQKDNPSIFFSTEFHPGRLCMDQVSGSAQGVSYMHAIHVYAGWKFTYFSVILLKALGHAIRADCLQNLKPDAIMPHLPTQ